MPSSTKYCALCEGETYSLWSLSTDGDTAIVPLCIHHEPQLRRLFRLCKEDESSLSIPDGMMAPRRRASRGTKKFTPLDWTPPEK